MALENPGQKDGVYLQFHGPHSPRSQVKLPSHTSGSGHAIPWGAEVCHILPLCPPDTFSCKIRKSEREDDRLGVDALSKTGSPTCKDQEVSLSEPELKSKGRAVNADH